MNKDVDLEQFAKILDYALNSDVPSVKKALSNFLLVASLCMTEPSDEQEVQSGPFERLLHNMSELERRVRTLERLSHSPMYGPGGSGSSGSFGGGSSVQNPYYPMYTSNTINSLNKEDLDQMLTRLQTSVSPSSFSTQTAMAKIINKTSS